LNPGSLSWRGYAIQLIDIIQNGFIPLVNEELETKITGKPGKP
jgi:hypothetical protein